MSYHNVYVLYSGDEEGQESVEGVYSSREAAYHEMCRCRDCDAAWTELEDNGYATRGYYHIQILALDKPVELDFPTAEDRES